MPRPKKPVFPRFTDLPPKEHPCFSDKEWKEWWDAYNAMFWNRVRHPNVYAIACEDCDLDFQVVSILRGTCLPPDPSVTPIARRLAGEVNADDAAFPVLQHS